MDSIVNSEEYKNLKKYYSLAIKEYERVSKDLEDITTERDAFRSAKEARAMLMSEEHQKTLKEIQCQSDIHNSFYKVSHDSEVLRCEFETVKEEYNKTVKQSEWDEMKATLNTLRSMNRSLKSEKIRLREKDKQSQKDINTLKSELTSLKEAQDKCLLVPLEDVSNAPPEDVNKIRQEYESLCKEVKRLGAMEKQEKQKQVEVSHCTLFDKNVFSKYTSFRYLVLSVNSKTLFLRLFISLQSRVRIYRKKSIVKLLINCPNWRLFVRPMKC